MRFLDFNWERRLAKSVMAEFDNNPLATAQKIAERLNEPLPKVEHALSLLSMSGAVGSRVVPEGRQYYDLGLVRVL